MGGKGWAIAYEVTPLAKVLVKLVDEIVKEKDPETLGLLACSLAYQRAAALALVQQGEPENRGLEVPRYGVPRT